MSISLLTPHAGTVEDTESDALHRLVRHLVADGDRRARALGRRARRTLAEQAPGYSRAPLLTLAPRPRSAEDACPICGYWRCRCISGSTTTNTMAVTR